MTSPNRVPVAILGVTGRMGRSLLACIDNSKDLGLSGALASPESRWLHQDAGALAGPAAAGIVITADASIAVRGAKAAVAFTLPEATESILTACVRSRCPLVLGTTGHSPQQKGQIEQAAQSVPIVMASNFNLGVNLLFKLAELTAKILDEDYDIEVFEAHHRNKKDSPSGTALSIGEAAARGRGTTLEKSAVYARHGVSNVNGGIRERGAIGFSVLRGGDIVGDHTITFAGPGERLELTHRAHDRAGFAQGALRAAKWTIGKPPGLYSMTDVLGL